MEEEFPNPGKLLGELNPKGTLQEYSQRKWNCAPDYEILEVSGPDHDPSYKVQVSVHRHFKAIGEAKNRKQAESEAARKAINFIAKTDKTLSGLL
jgi:ribonuclease-3